MASGCAVRATSEAETSATLSIAYTSRLSEPDSAEKPKRQCVAGSADEAACVRGVVATLAQLGRSSLSTSLVRPRLSERRALATSRLHGSHAPTRSTGPSRASLSSWPRSQTSSRTSRAPKRCTERPRVMPSIPKWREGSSPRLTVSRPLPSSSPAVKPTSTSKVRLNSRGGGARGTSGVESSSEPAEFIWPLVSRATPSSSGQSHSQWAEAACR